jgi:hypothetical protein
MYDILMPDGWTFIFEDLFPSEPEVEKVCGECVHWQSYPSKIGGFCKNKTPRVNRDKTDTCGDFVEWPKEVYDDF